VDLLQNFGSVVLMLRLFISFSGPLYSDAQLKCHLYLASHTVDLAETRHNTLTLNIVMCVCVCVRERERGGEREEGR
jgi:hypothetical protein